MLAEYCISLGVDGFSKTEIKTGVATRLQAKYSNIISWHCLNHRLELSVHDVIKSCTESNHLKCFKDTLYATDSRSLKLNRELADCAKELGTQVNRIDRVLGVR